MSNYEYPTQNRYNDPFFQRNITHNTVYKQKYLSNVSNYMTKMIGDNLVLSGLIATPTFVPGTGIVNLAFTSGNVIHDGTLIQLTASINLDCNVAGIGDTPTAGNRLAVFTSFQYVETPDADTQTALVLSLYYIDALGNPIIFAGVPAFDATKNKIMVAAFNFIKLGALVVSVSEIPPNMSGEEPAYITVSGVNYYIRGTNTANINIYDLYKAAYDNFLAEFLFQDNSRL